MSEVCFHCKRSLNKKFKIKVGDKIYCAVCYEKLKKEDKIKTPEPAKKEEKCKCGNKCCEKKITISKVDRMVDEITKIFKEYKTTKSVKLDMSHGMLELSINLTDELGTEKKVYENNMKVLCHENSFRSIIKVVLEEAENEEKMRKDISNKFMEQNIQSLQEQIEKNKKEM